MASEPPDRPPRGGLPVLLLGSWIGGHLVVTRLAAGYWGLGWELPAQALAAALAQWLALGLFRRRPGPPA